MTRIFDEMARNRLFETTRLADFKYDGTPVKQMAVKPMSVSEARGYIASFHYSKTMPDSTKYVFAGYLNNILCGICVFGMGCGKNQYTSLIPNIKNGEYVELTRLWSPINMPRNTESKLISKSLSMLPVGVKLVLSFADEAQGHVGTIYQASNWYYCGVNNGGKMLIDSDGIVKHPRLIGIYKMRHPELAGESTEYIMQKYGFTYIDGGRKHRYVYLRGSNIEKTEMYNSIKDKIRPYPKQEKATNNIPESYYFDQYEANRDCRGECVQVRLLEF